MAPILFKSHVVLDERGSQVGIVPDSVTMYQWIDQRQCNDKRKSKDEEMDPDPGNSHPTPFF